MTEKMSLVSAGIHLDLPLVVVFSELCWGEYVDLVEVLAVVLGNNVENNVSPGLEWVSNYLKHGLRFFVGKTATGRRTRTRTSIMYLFS